MLDLLPTGATVLERTLPLPGLTQRRQKLEVDDRKRASPRCGRDPAVTMSRHTLRQVVRAAVVIAVIAALQNVNVRGQAGAFEHERHGVSRVRRIEEYETTHRPGSADTVAVRSHVYGPDYFDDLVALIDDTGSGPSPNIYPRNGRTGSATPRRSVGAAWSTSRSPAGRRRDLTLSRVR